MNTRFKKRVVSRSYSLKGIFFAFCAILFFLSGCGQKHTLDQYHYYQTFEELRGWFPIPPIITAEIIPHSGNYSCFTNEANPYSTTMHLRFNEIDVNKPKRIKTSVWCYLTDVACDGEFCLQIKNTANEYKQWKITPTKGNVSKATRWTKLELISDIEKEMFAPDNEISVFFWNKGKGKIYVDDFSVEFYREL